MRYHAGMTKTETMAALTPWVDRFLHHDCETSEIRCDTLIAALHQVSRELRDLKADRLRDAATIGHQARTIDALRAEIAGLLDGTRPTPNEFNVRRLGRLYHQEGQR